MKKINSSRILLISSASLTKGPGAIAMNMYDALCEQGCEVDVLTLHQEETFSKAKYIYKKDSRLNGFLFRVCRKLWKHPKNGYCFFYRKENYPPVPSTIVLHHIKKSYDAVVIFFWQGLLSFKTVDKLYDKLKCKFFFVCADFSPMSGGCHFTNGCQRFMTGCGCCPAFNSNNPNDFTHWNVIYRQKVYEKVKPVLMANSYMIENFFKKSFLLHSCSFLISENIIDHKLFKPLDRNTLYDKFKISQEKKYIIAFGCQSLLDERKGMSYLLDALDLVYQQMTVEERGKTLLLFIGNNGDKIVPRLKFDYRNLGFISISELPAFYSVSSLFLCASVNDAGPSMVAQALACGTPVIAFQMGAALDLVKGQGTGYCAELRNSADLAKGILEILRMNAEAYYKLRVHCSEVSKEQSSKKAFAQLVLSAIHSDT